MAFGKPIEMIERERELKATTKKKKTSHNVVHWPTHKNEINKRRKKSAARHSFKFAKP